ncbi:hypothetical protein TGAM01_v202547 [Trichoderma gamsii]|uniref:Uncharacterized protein n=1 Tax=Trichoderma gamsii TaxID=398673 RepID=A0A2P4ZWN7_9HYPO|nr:hypothetical protein TGAM01_v202547 [Trichoderma gamsii]PON28700.1 hypothetical protein TGAM01_v202547 [Trichoderma gamsii]
MDSHKDECSEMGNLVDEIKQQLAIWEDYGPQSETSLPSVGSDARAPALTPDTPDHVLDAREKIMDPAFKLLRLAAGPSKIASVTISHSEFIVALNWLFPFKIFDLVHEEPIAYRAQAESANVLV